MSVEGWRKTAIQDLAADIKGSFIDGDWIEAPYITDQGIRLIQTGNIGVGDFIDKNKKYISEDAFVELKCKEVYIGDILICRLADPIGRSCIVPNLENKAITSVDVCILRINEKKYDKHFIAHSLNKQSFLDICQQTAGGSTRQRISRTNLGKIEIDIPKDKREQEQIAAVLSTIDRAIAQTEAIIAKQQRIKTGLMQDLLTKGIDEHGNIRSEATHEFKDSAIGRIPVEWEVSTLENQCIKVTDGTHQQVKTTEAGIPFLYVSCVREGMILWNRSAMIDLQTYKIISQGREPKHGVILYTVVGSYGYAALVETDAIFSFQRHIAYILPNQEKLDSKFLMEWMNSKKIKDYADKSALGNAQKTITLGELRQFPLFIPSKDEQAKIVQCLSKQNTIINQYCIVLDKLKTKKSGLMQDLLTGKVRVTELLKERDKIG
jgi:type I restriction enzyme S subunit